MRKYVAIKLGGRNKILILGSIFKLKMYSDLSKIYHGSLGQKVL